MKNSKTEYGLPKWKNKHKKPIFRSDEIKSCKYYSFGCDCDCSGCRQVIHERKIDNIEGITK